LISIVEEIRNIKSGKKELREFGITIGAVLLALAAFVIWRGRASSAYFVIFGILFIGFGVAAPALLKPLQKIWMALSVVIGFFMSRLILTILFYGVITPIGLLTRLLGKDILDLRISKERPSYWRECSQKTKTKESYEKQY
jgi:hypothetical protein